jgi:GGDEF domain-containing protein
MAAEPRKPLEPGRVAAGFTGALLLLAGAALAASVVGAPAWLETVGFVLGGAAVCGFVDLALARGAAATLGTLLALLVVADRVAAHADPVDRLWAVPAAIGLYLVLSGAATTPVGILARAVPAAVAVLTALSFRTNGAEIARLTTAVVPLALLGALIAARRCRTARARTAVDRHQVDLDAVVRASIELRNTADASEAARRIARIAAELLEGSGAVVWLSGPGQLVCAGSHGTASSPERELDDSLVARVMATGSVAVGGDEVVLPLVASGGAFGAVSIANPSRSPTTFVLSVLQVLGTQAGYALERLRAVESLIDVRYVDPVTGVGNRHAATATLATLRAGDAVLLLAVDELEHLRATEGDARADLVLGQIGLHMRSATRAGDLVARFGDDVFMLVLRDLSATAEVIVTRLLESWQHNGTATPLRAGAAVHLADRSPLETLDRATRALDAARLDLRDPVGAN